MQSLRILFIGIVAFIGSNTTFAQLHDGDTVNKGYFVGSTLFLLGNLDRENSPGFFQVNVGKRFSAQDVLSLEFKTWKYQWSLGIPWDSFEDPELKFPGHIRESGFAVAYQRFWWKGLYTGVHVMNAWQRFVDENGDFIEHGFQVFNTYRIGYQFRFFDNRFFIEPSFAITHRPFHSEMPESFRILDDQYPKYFIGEPGMHFGFNF